MKPKISDVRKQMSVKSSICHLESDFCLYWWARRDSNPQPPPCKGGRLPLTYVPISKIAATLALSQGVIVGKASICVKKRDCKSDSNAVQSTNFSWAFLSRQKIRLKSVL